MSAKYSRNAKGKLYSLESIVPGITNNILPASCQKSGGIRMHEENQSGQREWDPHMVESY